jgi:hypothetical protein
MGDNESGNHKIKRIKHQKYGFADQRTSQKILNDANGQRKIDGKSEYNQHCASDKQKIHEQLIVRNSIGKRRVNHRAKKPQKSGDNEHPREIFQLQIGKE